MRPKGDAEGEGESEGESECEVEREGEHEGVGNRDGNGTDHDVAALLPVLAHLGANVGASHHKREHELWSAFSREGATIAQRRGDGVHLVRELARRFDDECADLVLSERLFAPPEHLE